MNRLERSRPVRAAAEATGRDERDLAREFANRRVFIGIQGGLGDDQDCRETFLYAVNQVLRFCGAVSIGVPACARELIPAARQLAVGICGTDGKLSIVEADPTADARLTVGSETAPGHASVVVNSSGWVARMATSASAEGVLPRPSSPPNPLGALAAACLGVSQVFNALAGLPLQGEPVEISLFERTDGPVSMLASGPPLPDVPLQLDALLVGAGAVMHGFAYAIKRLPVAGVARVVDRQRLRRENFGACVLAFDHLAGVEKAEVLRDALAPAVEVIPYAEEFDPLFSVRLERGHFSLPPMVVAGLDNVATRHTVQRLWPRFLIDMGAGGRTAQVLLKRRAEPGMCVVEALAVPGSEQGDVARLSAETGLSAGAIRAMDVPVTTGDVAAAPDHMRAELEAACERGVLRCGFIRTRALDHEEASEDFAAAAPFVVGYAGVVAAAEAVKELMGLNQPGSLRYQFSFVSARSRAISPSARPGCECVAARRTAA